MGTLSIDAQQSQQIEKLQEDVEELTTKLNAVVTDVGTIKGKVDTLITDMGNVKDKIQANYTASVTGGGSASDAILKRLSDLDNDYKALSDHYQLHVTNAYNDSTYGHQSGGRTGNRGGGGGLNSRYTDLSTATVSSTGSVTQTASNASTTGTFNTSTTNVVTIETDSATRAREVARSTLTRLRDI